ncbi:MAG: hypothetical protein PHP44_10080 [Kiritimatiellae bacterium]|nr:hypothetical protein [Kiritimatiellia bacterium]MDD4736436.1 hypothetical protein [Kiritimatiellia bacterium]
MSCKEHRNKNLRRPTKSNVDRKRREKTQRNRLVALGMDEASVLKLNTKEVRTLLRRPLKVKAKVAAASAA